MINKTVLIYAAMIWLYSHVNLLHAYSPSGQKWANNTASFYVAIPGENGKWQTAFEAALTRWNNLGEFSFTPIRSFLDPCLDDAKNGAAFNTQACGQSFGGTTLAVTLSTFNGSNHYLATDIVFNANLNWDVYSGPVTAIEDFARVSVHELGHALGLDHESNNSSIMAPFIGSIEVPQQDDVNGVIAIYGTSTAPSGKPDVDMDGDGKSDVLWRHNSSGINWLYLMDGVTVEQSLEMNAVTDLDWKIVGTDDFNGDGKTDLLWRNFSTGTNWMYLMNGNVIQTSEGVNEINDQNWQVNATGDFDADGKADLLWRNAATGENWIYLMDGSHIKESHKLNQVADLNWKIVGVDDFDNDGRDDIFWRNNSTGVNWMYLMNGASIQQSVLINSVVDARWEVAGTADVNGDLKADIIWRNNSTGENWGYLMDGISILSSARINTVPDLNWQLATIDDINADGKADFIWRHGISGDNWVYLMEGLSVGTSQKINTVIDSNWEIQNQ